MWYDISKIHSKTKTVRIQVRVLLFSGISCNTMNLFSKCLFQFEVYFVVSSPCESVAVPLQVWVYPINSTVCHTVWWLRPACFLHSVNWWIFSFCQQGTSHFLELSHPAKMVPIFFRVTKIMNLESNVKGPLDYKWYCSKSLFEILPVNEYMLVTGRLAKKTRGY